MLVEIQKEEKVDKRMIDGVRNRAYVYGKDTNIEEFEKITAIEKANVYFEFKNRLLANHVYSFYSAEVRTTNKLVCLKIWKHYYRDVEIEKEILRTLKGNQFPKFLEDFDYVQLKSHIVMDYFGELSLFDYLLKKGEKPLSKEKVIFFLANIVLAIEKIHDNGYFHSTLNIAGMFLDKNKYLKIVDFCRAKKIDPSKTFKWKSNCFDSYFPPEMLDGREYGKPVDIWMLGVIAYYLMRRKFPFVNPFRVATPENKKKFAAMLEPEKMDTYRLSTDEVTFIKALLKKEPSERPKIQQVKTHEFFKSIKFESIENQTYRFKGKLYRYIMKY